MAADSNGNKPGDKPVVVPNRFAELLEKNAALSETELDFYGEKVLAVTPGLGISLMIGQGFDIEKDEAFLARMIAGGIIDPATRKPAFTEEQVGKLPLSYQLTFVTAIISLANGSMSIKAAKGELKKTRPSKRSPSKPTGRGKRSATISVQ